MAWSNERAGDDARQFSNGATSTAKKAISAAKKAKAAKNTAATAKGVAAGAFKLKFFMIVGGIFLAVVLLSGVVSLYPMAASNTVIHQNDAENLMADGDLQFSPNEDAEDDISAMREKYDAAESEISAILELASSRALNTITSDAKRSSINKPAYEIRYVSRPDSDLQAYHALSYIAMYSASVDNGLSDEMFEYFMDVSALSDISAKIRGLLGRRNSFLPFGNMIVGADYERDAGGNIIIHEQVEEYDVSFDQVPFLPATATWTSGEAEESDDASPHTDDGFGSVLAPQMVHVVETQYLVDIRLSIASVSEIATAAFGINMLDPYREQDYDWTVPTEAPAEDASSAGNEDTPSGSKSDNYQTYGDVIFDMVQTMGITLFGEDKWDEIKRAYSYSCSGSWSGSGGSYGSAQGVTSIAMAEYKSHLGEDGLPLSCDGDKYLKWIGVSDGRDIQWDGAFISWCIAAAGYGTSTVQPFLSPTSGYIWFVKSSRWKSAAESINSYHAMAGDILFFDYEQDGCPDRAVIITALDNLGYLVIGGDTSGEARSHTIEEYRVARNDPNILGIGRPVYTIAGNYYGVDTAAVLLPEMADILVREGYSFVGRYIGSFDYGKNIRQAEYDMYLEKGLAILLVFEADNATAKGGYMVGVNHAQTAVKYARLLGVPAGTVLFFAIDYGAPECDFPALLSYFQGINENIGEYRVGMYGRCGLVEYLHEMNACDSYWQCCAWSSILTADGHREYQVSGHCNAYQYEWDSGANSMAVHDMFARETGRSGYRVDLNVCDDLVGAGFVIP